MTPKKSEHLYLGYWPLFHTSSSNSEKLFHLVPVTNEPFHRVFGEQFADHINLFAVPVTNEENDKVLEIVVSDYCEDHISRRQIIDKLISEIADDVYRARTQAYLGSLTQAQLSQFHVFCGPKVSNFPTYCTIV